MAFHPIQGNALAKAEIQRRQLAFDAGPVTTGCLSLDDALGGGFSRGTVVGISADDENSVALPVAIQTLVRAVLSDETRQAAIITRHSAPFILARLRWSICVERERILSSEKIHATTESQCLERISLHTIFDIDGLWQALASMETAAAQNDATTQQGSQGEQGMEMEKEIPDSDASEELNSQCSSAETGQLLKARTPSGSPAVIVITSFTSLLEGLYIQRPRPLVHDLVLMLNMRIRRLSRSSAHLPLVVLLNDTKNINEQPEQYRSNTTVLNQDASKFVTELTSNSQLPAVPAKLKTLTTKFGSIFTNLLDLHILCQSDLAISQPATMTAGLLQCNPIYDTPWPSKITIRACIDLDTQGLWSGALGPTVQREGRTVLLEI